MTRIFKTLTIFCLIGIFSCAEPEVLPEDNQNIAIESRQSILNLYHKRITPCEASTLKYYVDEDCLGSPYEDPIAGAILAYNNFTGTSIHFQQVSSASLADIAINCFDDHSTLSECGSGLSDPPVGSDPEFTKVFPSGGTIGRNIYLRINWTSCKCTEIIPNPCGYTDDEMECVLQRTVMHELGHALGMGHNEFFNVIPGTQTSEYDPNSVFNSGPIADTNCEYCFFDCTFTPNDLIALRLLYPRCLIKPQISMVFDPCNSLIYLRETANADPIHRLEPILPPPSTPPVIEINSYGSTYNWSLSGLSSPPLMSNGINNAVVRAPYSPGQIICASLTLSNSFLAGETGCYTDHCKSTISTSCQFCFSAPACTEAGGLIEGELVNDCSTFNPCPTGYTCIDGICCPASIPCQSTTGCPQGFICINGICVDIS